MKVASIECLFRSLNDASVPFVVVGGLAVVAHGYGRQTQDVDLVIRLRPDCIHAAFAALETLGYRPRVPVTAEMMSDPSVRERLVRERGMMVLAFHSERHPETPVDLVASEPFDFDAEHSTDRPQDRVARNTPPFEPFRFVRSSSALRRCRKLPS